MICRQSRADAFSGPVMLKHPLMILFWLAVLIVADQLAWGGVVSASVMLDVKIAVQAALSDFAMTP